MKLGIYQITKKSAVGDLLRADWHHCCSLDFSDFFAYQNVFHCYKNVSPCDRKWLVIQELFSDC
jgi:hypothetical protein